jgi:hypothetical protein
MLDDIVKVDSLNGGAAVAIKRIVPSPNRYIADARFCFCKKIKVRSSSGAGKHRCSLW